MGLESHTRELTPGGSLATIAVELLSSGWTVRPASAGPMELAQGAQRAIAQRLAGIYCLGVKQLGAADAVSGAMTDELERARRAEVADSLAASRQTAEILQAMAAGGIPPVVLKGRSLAERLWPQPWMRPPGDLDLLIEEQALGDAIGILAQLGFRPDQGEAPARWRPAPQGTNLRRGRSSGAVDLHTRLFRAVGSGFAAGDALSRAVPGSLCGVPVRLLAPADEILFLLLHAAKHGAVRPKWMLDLHAARLAYSPGVWTQAAERAIAYRATRPFWAAARLLGVPLPSQVMRALRPPPLARALIPSLVRASETGEHHPLMPVPEYAIHWFLEDRMALRMTRLLGVIERILSVRSRIAGARPPAAAELSRSDRWLEGALRSGHHSLWVTLEGSSMEPSVRPGDELLVAPVRPGEALREGELLLARRGGFLVVHRLIRKLEDAIVMRGDGAWRDDLPIAERDVMARVVSIRRRG